MNWARHLPRATGPALLGSFASLASQALFAAFLLKLFEPAAVGVFSLVNQVAFSWATLALAQSPLSLLADRADPAHGAKRAWRDAVASTPAREPDRTGLESITWESRLRGLPVWDALP